MQDIKSVEPLMAIAVRQGVVMQAAEAEVILGYMEGTDHLLVADDDGNLFMHDLQGVDEEDEPYNIRDAVEFCSEVNDDLICEGYTADKPDENYLRELRKDGYILDILLEKARSVIPPRVRMFNVIIVEYLRKEVPVEAASWEEAKTKVEKAWQDGEYILDADDFAGVNFTLGS